MTFADRLTFVRKKKKLSQAEVGSLIGINGDAYGRYERAEVRPTIEMATKIADALNVSLDYLVGKTDMELDNDMLKRVQAVSNLPTKEKETVFLFLDSFLDRMKLQGIL
jgi:transcriptional regulator with XRE-family HTH domain